METKFEKLDLEWIFKALRAKIRSLNFINKAMGKSLFFWERKINDDNTILQRLSWSHVQNVLDGKDSRIRAKYTRDWSQSFELNYVCGKKSEETCIRNTRTIMRKFLVCSWNTLKLQMRSKENVCKNQFKIVNKNFHRKMRSNIQQEKLWTMEPRLTQRVTCSQIEVNQFMYWHCRYKKQTSFPHC